MRYLALFIFLFLNISFLAPFPVFAQEKREWKSCEKDSDCVVVGGGCCLSAVNKSFASQGKAYCEKQNEVVRCIRYMDPDEVSVKCESTPVPCMNNAPEGCLSKKKKCVVSENMVQ